MGADPLTPPSPDQNDETLSLWERAAGRGYVELAPGLRDYFSELPAGSIGVGDGVFDRVGTPRRWLWPALWIAGLLGIVWPCWETDVPFRVVNRPVEGDRAARREFRFRSGSRFMVDRIAPGPDGTVVDRLGHGGLVSVRLRPTIVDAGLRLASERVSLFGIPVPMRVDISEVAQDGGGQRVDLVVSAAGIGRIYEYAGVFRYRIVAEG